MIICVSSVASHTRGTATTEQLRHWARRGLHLAVQEPRAANDPPAQEVKAARWKDPPWLSWDDVPTDVHWVASLGPWFIEVFSGTARLTQVVASLGIPCLPPIDVTLSPSVPVAFDVVDARKWDFFMQLVTLAAIAFAHFGTPCNTLSAARKDDGGPPPLRSVDQPWGLPGLSPDNEALLFLGNLFLIRTAEACEMIVRMGGDFSVENPLHSHCGLFRLLWLLLERHELSQWSSTSACSKLHL